MRRGYLRGLVIGGIVGLAVGKMLRYKESMDSDNNRDRSSRFHEDKDFPEPNYEEDHRHLDSGFNEKDYEDHFSQYHDDEDEVGDIEDQEYQNHHQMLDEEVSSSMVLENHDGSETPRISRRKTARVNLNKRKRMGSLDE